MISYNLLIYKHFVPSVTITIYFGAKCHTCNIRLLLIYKHFVPSVTITLHFGAKFHT